MATRLHQARLGRPERRVRRPRHTLATEVVAALLVVGLLAVALRPGVGLGAVIALVVLALLALGNAITAGWRRITHRERPRRTTRAARGRRVLVLASAIALVPAAISLADTLSAPSNSTLSIRMVEWLRDHGGRGLVSQVERVYYTLTAPAKGGPALRSLPVAGVGLPVSHHQKVGHQSAALGLTSVYRPRDIRPVIRPALPGEGVWRVTQHRFAHSPTPPLLVTSYRPDPSYPRVVAGLAWIDPRYASVRLYPGLQEPPNGASQPYHEVPPALRGSLLATFNSGFKHADSGGGFFSAGRLLEPLRDGQGTILVGRHGSADVTAWSGGATPGPGIELARQNLPLIVDHARPNPDLSNGPQWGATLGNAILVWRSGLGVDRHGDLIYAAANDQTVAGLAQVLIHAGAVRAVALDINSYWVTLNTYASSGAHGASKLLPDMTRSPLRYLTPDDRDFFAVYAR